jgi:hypothetical protein
MTDKSQPDQMALSDQMAEAYRNQMEHIAKSMRINRTGWTLKQWTTDAHKQFNELDGTIMSLNNGHITALFREIEALERALAEFSNAAGFGHVSAHLDAIYNTPLSESKPVAEYFKE